MSFYFRFHYIDIINNLCYYNINKRRKKVIKIKHLEKMMLKVPLILKMFLNLFLIILVIFLLILIGKEIYHLGELVITTEYTADFYKDFLKGLLTFFLYFEFVLMIVKYFEEDYHFPLRYFMYIGITATIRLIIVDHESATDTLKYATVILILVVGYGIITYLSLLKEKNK